MTSYRYINFTTMVAMFVATLIVFITMATIIICIGIVVDSLIVTLLPLIIIIINRRHRLSYGTVLLQLVTLL